MKAPNKTLAAFEQYLLDGNVRYAMGMIASNEEQLKVLQALLYDSYIAGSLFSVRRCETEHGRTAK